jgi:hypothetical protein
MRIADLLPFAGASAFVGVITIPIRKIYMKQKIKKTRRHAESVSAPHQKGEQYTGLQGAKRLPGKREYPVGCRNKFGMTDFISRPNTCGDNTDKGENNFSKFFKKSRPVTPVSVKVQ